jgi:hypothetical protein
MKKISGTTKPSIARKLTRISESPQLTMENAIPTSTSPSILYVHIQSQPCMLYNLMKNLLFTPRATDQKDLHAVLRVCAGPIFRHLHSQQDQFTQELTTFKTWAAKASVDLDALFNASDDSSSKEPIGTLATQRLPASGHILFEATSDSDILDELSNQRERCKLLEDSLTLSRNQSIRSREYYKKEHRDHEETKEKLERSRESHRRTSARYGAVTSSCRKLKDVLDAHPSSTSGISSTSTALTSGDGKANQNLVILNSVRVTLLALFCERSSRQTEIRHQRDQLSPPLTTVQEYKEARNREMWYEQGWIQMLNFDEENKEKVSALEERSKDQVASESERSALSDARLEIKRLSDELVKIRQETSMYAPPDKTDATKITGGAETYSTLPYLLQVMREIDCMAKLVVQ